jgi:hypothetical protein
MTAARTCACGCGQPIPDDHRADAGYIRGHRKHRPARETEEEKAGREFWQRMANRPPTGRGGLKALARRLGARFPDDAA